MVVYSIYCNLLIVFSTFLIDFCIRGTIIVDAAWNSNVVLRARVITEVDLNETPTANTWIYGDCSDFCGPLMLKI